MKRIVSLVLSIVMLASCLSIGMFTSMAANEPTPVYYENFANKTTDDLKSKIVRCHDAEMLKLDVVPKKVNGTDSSNALYMNTRMKNNEGATVLNLYDLANGVDNFSVFVRFAFTDELKNSGSYSYTSRFALALNIDGEIAEGETVHAVELRQWATYDKDGTKNTGKGIRHLTNTYANGKTTASSAIGQGLTTPDWELNKFYELAAVVSNGQIYVYVNGKLMPLGTDGATSIPFTKTASGIGFFATLCGLYIDDFRVYDSAYVPAGYDAIDGAANTVEAAFAAALPALPANVVADKVAVPVYYENFATTTADGIKESIVRNNSPSNLSVKVEPYFVGEETTGTNMMYFNTRNKNNDSHTVFKFYDLPETATNFAVYVKFAFSSNRDNWSSSSSSRLGIVYNIADGKIENGESVNSIEFTYNKEDKLGTKALRAVKNTFNSETSTSAEQSGQYVETPIAALDTFYELAIVVSEGKLYTYLNGKLMPLGTDGATSIDYTKTASGIGLFGAYTTCWVDDIRVYDSAYVAAGYDALTAAAFTGDACKEALPALPATCVSDVQEKVVEPDEPEVPLGPAPEAGTILYEQNFDNVTTETLGAIQIKDAAQDFVWGVENGTLMMSAPTSSSSHGMLQLYELPKNVTSFTIVMQVRFGSVADMSEKNLIGPAYSIKDDQNWCNLSLRANGTYNFTRQTDNNWVSNKTYPEGGSSRNSKYYSVESDTWYTLCMVVTTEGRIRSYINGILQPDNVPLIQDGYGIGTYIRNGTSYVDNMVVYAGQYVPEGYDDITGEGSYDDDLYIEEETEEDTTVAGGENETTGEEVTTKVEDTTTKKPEETTASNKTDDKKGGCGAVVGTASICLIAILAGGALTLRKKEN